MRWFRNRLHWRKKAKRSSCTARRTVTPHTGLCDPCRELLVKRPVVVLRAESYTVSAANGGGA